MSFVDIEVILKGHNTTNKSDIINICKVYLSAKTLKPGDNYSQFIETGNRILLDDVERIVVCDSAIDSEIDITKCHINWYLYILDKNGPQTDNCEDDSGNEINLATQWVLPSSDLDCLWENLIYDNEIKRNLIKYAATMMEFADKNINTNIINFNRVILLHGPPGTGKTSLCKALAQKLSIKMQSRYKQCVLIEINSHSLFSKWFSESGKLVAQMFAKIKEIIEDKVLVCVLIDEIESLAHARDQCMSGTEPSDSIKVVNAVLTQLDQIKRYPNVIILATSNMTGAIDIAFIDRADVKQYLGLPSVNAIYQIYSSCIKELLKARIIQEKQTTVDDFKKLKENNFVDNSDFEMSRYLLEISQISIGLSGRALRKIPFLAFSLFLEDKTTNMKQYFDALKKAVIYEFQQREHFSKN